MKFLTLDDQLEELWMRKGWDESVYIYRGATAIELLKEVPKFHELDDCNIVILSVGSNDIDISWQEQKDIKDERARENANRAVIKDIAADMLNIGEYFTQKGKEVIWIGAPLRKNKSSTGFLALEEEVEGRQPTGMYVYAVAQRIVKDVDKTKSWSEGTAIWFDRDGVHLKKEAVREILLFIVNKYDNAELIPGAIPEARIRKEDLFRGRCWACGESRHMTKDCPHKDKIYCTLCEAPRHKADVASCSIVCVSTVAKKGLIREDCFMDGGNNVSREHIAALVMLVVNYGISHAIVLQIP